VTNDMMPLLFGPQEQAWLQTVSPLERGVAATILFSAKEAYFKALNPLTGQKPSFPAAEVRLDDEGFAVTWPDADPDDWKGPVRGRLVVRGDLVITAICLPRSGA
jgi:4'-phosphopantetheinyl transferase EntD